MSSRVLIPPACQEDRTAISSIIGPVVQAGDTYTLDPAIGDANTLAYWLGADKEAFVAEEDGRVIGTYYMRPNQAGGGSHVCNCGYITSRSATGRGVPQAMYNHSLAHARLRGYRAMQFNFVVSTNERAVRLWETMGFEIAGRLPLAFFPTPITRLRRRFGDVPTSLIGPR